MHVWGQRGAVLALILQDVRDCGAGAGSVAPRPAPRPGVRGELPFCRPPPPCLIGQARPCCLPSPITPPRGAGLQTATAELSA